ncbi:DUF262 domain-containing protein [Reinekea marina]|uniref:DUF262 domain-containing protein n=1 Tax=Reinekea marina TaxID=1310421 RepID=A0ABV7WQH6_9GAMM|nr:DUF262 domain-containing protein [Reinekea marina]MDN3647572.1 DUF262 domain-containing protein [Reinekea marina]
MSNSPRDQLNPDSLSVSELLCNNYFEIPKNQRDYRWGKEQLEKLWNDLMLTVEEEKGSVGGDSSGHFLGSIVVIGKKQSLDSNRWLVVDGQQRITTLTILLTCLKSYVQNLDAGKTKRLLSNTIYSAVLSPEANEAPRIRLNSESKFYEGLIADCEDVAEREFFFNSNFNASNEVQNNIKTAFEFFDLEIKNYCNSAGEGWQEELTELVQTLNSSFYLLLVRVSNLWMAYRVFETLNERGLDLTQAELIKNVLIEHASETGKADIDLADRIWKKFVDNYESQPVTKLDMPHLIQFSYSFRHSFVKKGDIFDTVSRELRAGELNVFSFLDELEVDSRNWTAFLQGDLVNWSDKLERAQFSIVDPLWKKHCAPFILSLMNSYQSDLSYLEKALSLCEHYLFRQGMVSRDSVGVLQKVFTDAAILVNGRATIYELTKFFKRHSPDEEFIDHFKKFSVTNMKQAYYVLWKIEAMTDGHSLIKPNWQSSAQHVEHIMPKKPDPDWEGVAELEGYPKYLNRVGNLLVLEGHVNQHIKNRNIEYKIKNSFSLDYSNSKHLLAKELVSNFDAWAVKSQWNFDAINLRQQYMAEKYAASVWSL